MQGMAQAQPQQLGQGCRQQYLPGPASVLLVSRLRREGGVRLTGGGILPTRAIERATCSSCSTLSLRRLRANVYTRAP